MNELMTWVKTVWSWHPTDPEKGSVTIENVIWALAVIAIAAIVVAAITAYVTGHSNKLIGS